MSEIQALGVFTTSGNFTIKPIPNYQSMLGADRLLQGELFDGRKVTFLCSQVVAIVEAPAGVKRDFYGDPITETD